MSQPPIGAEGYPPQPPGGTGYGSPYGGQPAAQQYGAAQPDPTLPQPATPASAPPVPGQYPPGAAPVPGQHGATPVPGQYAPGAAPVPGQYGAAPVSAPGHPQPMSAPPMSAPPVSGPGFGPQPMSAPPGSVPPYGAPAAGTGKGRSTLILALVAGLLFVAGGVMTGLYVTTNGKLHRTEQRVSQRDGTIAANRQEIDKLKADLQTVRDKLSDTEQDLTGTKNDRDEQARQKKVIATCLDKLTTAIAAASAGNKAAFDKANKGLDKVCDEAENYL
ncbi:hypothetical protein ONA91_02310 [Micromonospora sp. DR5-3]|uniref:hypothetical protein n=1 Tax=unclassified Micromonospora TaxID=2617518 RepID=UPI0011D3C7FE|nr:MULTISPECIES: hypothetical protein [unclassified Micromonospora]MCW3813289.1 hypothetical protein [Micromonospora sp. DR5-3]TYC24678.1 hypothetical protein FXF52_08900 [Micromonospora sp. MP36]